MCTLYSFDRELWNRHSDDLVDRICTDSVINNDGASMLLDSGTLIRSVDQGDGVNTILNVIEDLDWDRVWIHLRAATTGYVGLDGCHGFSSSNGVFVFHNGVLTHKNAGKFSVDSELIAAAVRQYGIAKTVRWLQKSEAYANVFLVDTKSDEYHISRSFTGNLHTDGHGNFSTNPIPYIIDQAVPTYTTETYKVERPSVEGSDDRPQIPPEVTAKVPAIVGGRPTANSVLAPETKTLTPGPGWNNTLADALSAQLSRIRKTS
jgi:hypothetical protein